MKRKMIQEDMRIRDPLYNKKQTKENTINEEYGPFFVDNMEN